MNKLQLQKIRRHAAREQKLSDAFNATPTCCQYKDIVNASVYELDHLAAMIKKIKIHRKATDRLIKEKLIIDVEIKEELAIDGELLAHLNNKYSGIKGKRLKYKSSRKDKQREFIITENLDVLHNCFSTATENTIKKFYNDIDLSRYEPSSRDYEALKGTKTKAEPPPEKCEVPKTIIKETKCKIVTIPLKQSEPAPDDSDSDSDIESYIKKVELKKTIDRDTNTKDEINGWKKKINKLFREEIEDDLCKACDTDEDEEGRTVSLVNAYISRTKRKNRGKYAKIGKWANRNPQSTRKIIQAIIDKIQRKIEKEVFYKS